MKYLDIKSVIEQMTKEHMDNGATRDEAERRILVTAIGLLNAQKIGLIDVILMFRMLEYEYPKDFAKKLESAKAMLREQYGLDRNIRLLKEKGFSENQATITTLLGLNDLFVEDTIKSPEVLDLALWSLGYRLKESYYLDYYAGKKPEFDYEEDD